MSTRLTPEVEQICAELREISERVETTTFENGMVSVDFGLFERSYVGELSEREATVDGDLEDTPTQRSGGMYRSLFVFGTGGNVIEYNIRFPPVSRAEYSKSGVTERLHKICQTGMRRYAGPQALSPGIFVREYLGGGAREKARKALTQLGDGGHSMPEKAWYPHIRSERCAVDPDDLLRFTEFAVEEFDRQFSATHEWATPDAEQYTPSASGGADVPSSAVRDLEVQQEDGGTVITFRFPDAETQSEIRDTDGGELVYEFHLPPYDATEHGKILLRKAVEHVFREDDILDSCECTVTTDDGAHVPRITGSDRSLPIGNAGHELAKLVEGTETIEQRSQLS